MFQRNRLLKIRVNPEFVSVLAMVIAYAYQPDALGH